MKSDKKNKYLQVFYKKLISNNEIFENFAKLSKKDLFAFLPFKNYDILL